MVMILSSAACMTAAGSIILVTRTETPQRSAVQYVLYLGTNDKDTNALVCTLGGDKVRAQEILIE